MDHDKRAHAEAWLHYADELGISPFYRDRESQSSEPRAESQAPSHASTEPSPAANAMSAAVAPRRAPAAVPAPKQPAPVAPFVPASPGLSLFDAAERIANDSLPLIRETIGDCTRCKLHKARTNIVFGVGNPMAELVFVGEGPGHDEDVQGEPFVGRAGKLLTQMIEAMSLRREDVYICNVVKCRPPENRLPERDEIATCSPFLIRQLDVIRPKVICCLGACSAQTLLQTTQGISRFRGEWLEFRGSKLIATYHPAYLLRNPAAKPEVWKDLQKVMAVLGLQPKRK
ncbi:MAG TPA: uracil-DNA glycosylase [Candidatus Acidoferrales bacterium]|nr:uracil-DNA glycosylase [Candidatus Acidoferrales bacterium]